MPDRDRRMDQGGPGHRGRRSHPLSSRDRGAVAPASASAASPFYLRSDNGPEFVSRALLTWIDEQGIDTALIDPGKPWQNGATESFNGKFRDECLSLEWFRSQGEAKVVIESWRRHFNEVRPHSSLGYLTPAEFAAKIEEQDAASRPATGRIAAVCGASALRPVASPSRKGQAKASTEGGVLKLGVVRRSWAGQILPVQPCPKATSIPAPKSQPPPE